MKSAITVLGIAGGSGAGKTSLTEGLVNWFNGNVTVLHLDDYFIADEAMPTYAGVTNWDDPRSINDKQLHSDMSRITNSDGSKTELLIVEGFLLLHFPKLRELLDVSIFLNAPHEIINKRRVHDANDHYREKVIKPMYEKYVLPSATYADHVIDITHLTKEEVLLNTISILKPSLEQ